MNEQQNKDARARYHAANSIRKHAIKNGRLNLDSMVLLIMEASDHQDLGHMLYDQDMWFMLHQQYDAEDHFNTDGDNTYEAEMYDWYWHGDFAESYCNDYGIQQYEKALWEKAMKRAGRKDWLAYIGGV